MKQRDVAVLVAGLVLALAGAPAHGEAGDPVAAARGFLAAVQRGDCEAAWRSFSAASQARIVRESEARIRREPYYAERFAPKNLYCQPTYAHRFGQYDASSARLVQRSAGRAVVGVERRVPAGFLIPGFWSTRTETRAAELRLVEEAGGWKVVVPQAR